MRVASVLLVLLACAPALARADNGKHGKAPPPKAAPTPEPPKPWAEGVTQENQDKAIGIYKEGNVLLEQSQYKDALAKFTTALTFWDHPAIHYNAAVCLINLDRPVDAYEHVVASLKFGEAPLGNDLFLKGQTYQEMLGHQIGELDITAQESNVEIALDGEPLPVATGEVKRRVKSGDHQILTKKAGFETESQTVHVEGGETKQIVVIDKQQAQLPQALVIVMKPLPVQRKLVRRWDAARPYEVIATGAVVMLASGLPFYLMSSSYSDYRSAVLTNCKTGCYDNAIPASVDSKRKAGDRDQVIGWTMLGAGTVVVLGGVVGALLNGQHYVTGSTTIAPTVGADHAGVSISGRW